MGAAHAVGLGETHRLQTRRAAVGDRLHLGAGGVDHAAVGGQPEVAGAVGDDFENGGHRQAVARIDRGQPPVAQAQYAAVGGDPQGAVVVFAEGVHVGGIVEAGNRQAVDDAVFDIDQAGRGADPDTAVAGFMQRHHVLDRQSLVLADARDLGAALAEQPARGADPEIARAVFEDGAHLGTEQRAVLGHAFAHLAVLPVQQAGGIHADPHAAVAGVGQAQDRLALHAQVAVDRTDAAAFETAQAARGADHDAAVRPFQQGPHVVVAQAAVAVDGGERQIGEADQAVAGAGPQAAFAVHEQRTHVVVGHSVVGIEHFETGRTVAAQALVDGTEPDAGGAVGLQADHGIAGRGQIAHRAVADQEQAALGAQIQSAAGRVGHGIHGAGGRGAAVEQARAAVLEPDQTATGGRPDDVLAIGFHHVDASFGHALFGAPAHGIAVRRDVRQAVALVGHPQAALAVFEGIGNVLLRETLGMAVVQPAALAVDGDAAARSGHHQTAARTDGHPADAVILQRRGVGWAEDAEVLAVVAHQAFPGGEPQVAVRRLRDGVDLVVRQAVAGAPGGTGIFGNGFPRRAARHAAAERHQRQQDPS